MTNKIRMRMGPLSVVSTIAVIGLLAAFIALTALPGGAYADGHGPPPPPPPPSGAVAVMVARRLRRLRRLRFSRCPRRPEVMAEASASQELTVTWMSVTGASGYQVDYKLASATNYQLAAIVGANATSYTIMNLSSNSNYSIRLTAIGTSGQSLNSTPVVITVMTAPVAYDLLLSHEDSSGNITCADRTSPRPQCASGDSDFDGDGDGTQESDFVEVHANLPADAPIAGMINVDAMIDKANIRTVDARVRIHAEIHTDSPLDTTTVSIRIENSDATASFDSTPGITYETAGLNAPGVRSIEDGTVDIQIRDAATRVFDLYVNCEGQPIEGMLDIEVRDEDQNLVAEALIMCAPAVISPPADTISTVEYSVASYGDWEYHNVTDGYIDANSSGVTHLVNDHPNQQIGWLERDEPVVNAYELGMSEVENLTQRVNPEEGQRTIEVLVGAPNVQLTVTSAEEGPAYIRFLDSNMEAFGTDVDEEPEQAGADVVGLDSQGRLEMNLMLNLSAAKALAYDQYDVVVPGNPSNNAYLRGNAGDYYQGKFRFFNPCPSELGKGHHFYVEVYEKSGKYLKTTEKVVCILQPGIVPTELAVTTFSDIPGRVRLSWVEARTASAHWVIAINEATRIAVPDSLQKIASPGGTALINGLAEDTEYIFAVAAERVDANGDVSYSNASFIIQAMNWN